MWCRLGPLCNGIPCVGVIHRFLEHIKRMITKFACLDIGKASKHELQAQSVFAAVLAPTVKCGVSWDPHVTAFYVLVFFIGSWSMQKE